MKKSHEANSRCTKCERLVKWEQPFLRGGWRQGFGISCSEVAGDIARGQRLPCKDLGGVPEQKGRGQRFWEHQDVEVSGWRNGLEGEIPGCSFEDWSSVPSTRVVGLTNVTPAQEI